MKQFLQQQTDLLRSNSRMYRQLWYRFLRATFGKLPETHLEPLQQFIRCMNHLLLEPTALRRPIAGCIANSSILSCGTLLAGFVRCIWNFSAFAMFT